MADDKPTGKGRPASPNKSDGNGGTTNHRIRFSNTQLAEIDVEAKSLEMSRDELIAIAWTAYMNLNSETWERIVAQARQARFRQLVIARSAQ